MVVRSGSCGCVRLLPALLAALSPAGALADDARYQDVIVGARAVGLGGAFTAVADDASGLMYNPAGLADAKRANLSVSTSLYGFERQSRGGIFTGLPLTGLPRLTTGDINVIPSSAGSVMGLGELLPDGSHRHAVAFGLMVPALRSVNLSEDTAFKDGNLVSGVRRSAHLFDRQLWAGLGYAYRLGQRVRMGAALHYVLRSVDAVDEYTLIQWNPEHTAVFVQNVASELQLQSGSLVGVLGVKLQLAQDYFFGLSVSTQSLQIHHNGEYKVRSIRTGPTGGSYDSAVVPISNGPEINLRELGSRMPFTARGGAAWVRKANFTLTGDVSLHAPIAYRLVPEQNGVDERLAPLATRVERNWVLNGAVGLEKLLGPTWSMAVGAYTNLPSSPPLRVDDRGILLEGSSRLSRVPMAGLTFAAGYLTTFSLTRVGFQTAFGVGDRVGVKNQEQTVATGVSPVFERYRSSEWIFYVFLSSTFRYGEGKSERGEFGLPGLQKVLGG